MRFLLHPRINEIKHERLRVVDEILLVLLLLAQSQCAFSTHPPPAESHTKCVHRHARTHARTHARMHTSQTQHACMRGNGG